MAAASRDEDSPASEDLHLTFAPDEVVTVSAAEAIDLRRWGLVVESTGSRKSGSRSAAAATPTASDGEKRDDK